MVRHAPPTHPSQNRTLVTRLSTQNRVKNQTRGFPQSMVGSLFLPFACTGLNCGSLGGMMGYKTLCKGPLAAELVIRHHGQGVEGRLSHTAVGRLAKDARHCNESMPVTTIGALLDNISWVSLANGPSPIQAVEPIYF